ncbi:MAG TPA: hypothetical protein VIO36_05295 [Anaerolineaceae bacterium]
MDLISFYVKEVGQRLPATSREDIEKEIRTLIEDTLEDESGAQGRPVDQAMIVDVLKRLGSPQKMAARYLPERYLIGPRLFPQYVTVLKIVLAIVSVLAVTGFAVTAGLSSTAGISFAEMLGKVIGGLMQAVFQAAAIVTLVFAVLEYFQPDLKLSEENWNPLDMKPQPEEERVSLVGGMLAVIFTIIAAIVFNFYPEWIGVSNFVNGQWLHTPVLSETFFRYLPFINILWAAEIVKEIVVMARGRWTNPIRWADVFINLFTAVLAAIMLTGPSVVALDPAGLNRMGWGSLDAEAVNGLMTAAQMGARVTLGIIMGLSLMEMGKGLYRIITERRMLATA